MKSSPFRYYDNEIKRLSVGFDRLTRDLAALTKAHLRLIENHAGTGNLSLSELEAMIQNLEDRFPDAPVSKKE